MYTDILNPAGSDLNPNYGYSDGLPPMISRFQARSGGVTRRRLLARGRVYELSWEARQQSTAEALRRWEAQYEDDVFSYFDAERNRYFTGCFDGPLRFSPAGYNRWNIRGVFVEVPGESLYQYPTNWDRDARFYESRVGTRDLVKLSAGWNYFAGEGHVGQYVTTTNNATAEWLYFGYGFRLWSEKKSDRGIVEVSLDGTVLQNVDLYAAGNTASAAVFTKADVPLGQHRVKLRCTNTKNAASSAVAVTADAIEVMR